MGIPSGYVSGQVVQAVPTALAYAIFNETQASATNGGTATSGSFVKRTLNTTVVNTITDCSIASSVITLPAGTYIVQGFGTVFDVTTYKSRLQNTTDSTTAIQGTSGYVQNGNYGYGEVIGRFVIAASKNFELQTRVGQTVTTNGYGAGTAFGDEVYSQIIITKVA